MYSIGKVTETTFAIKEPNETIFSLKIVPLTLNIFHTESFLLFDTHL